MGLVALALAPVLWARAARVTAERLHDDVHSAAFSQASEDVSRRYEAKLSTRERALRAEIEELEASRDKISAEASARVGELEEVRTRLEREIAARDAALAESREAAAALAGEMRGLEDRARSLGEEAADLGARAEALARAAPAPEPVAEPAAEPAAETVAETWEEPPQEPAASGMADAGHEAEPEPEPPAEGAPPSTLSDRIRALREGVSA